MVGGFFLPLRLSLPSAYGINPSGAIAASPSDETATVADSAAQARSENIHRRKFKISITIFAEILYLLFYIYVKSHRSFGTYLGEEPKRWWRPNTRATRKAITRSTARAVHTCLSSSSLSPGDSLGMNSRKIDPDHTDQNHHLSQ